MPDEQNTCPKCGRAIPLADINIEQGVLLCRSCGAITALADLARASAPPPHPFAPDGGRYTDPPAAETPPAGCTLETGPVGEIVLTASARSLPLAFFMGIFCLLWNSVTWIFVVIIVSTLLLHAGVVAPWLRGGPPNIPLPIAIIMALFVTPFVLIGLFVLGLLSMALAGDVRVTIRTDSGEIFTGVGPVGRRTPFSPSEVTSVRLYHGTPTRNRQSSHAIEFGGATRLRFGSLLPMPRAAWLCAATRIILVPLPPASAR
ncbi:MAG: hypothetical protein KF859_14100 [Phycisphaeraceae bacterium]|nr:hypothetical protein [Phycisphaeraceae bacterium]